MGPRPGTPHAFKHSVPAQPQIPASGIVALTAACASSSLGKFLTESQASTQRSPASFAEGKAQPTYYHQVSKAMRLQYDCHQAKVPQERPVQGTCTHSHSAGVACATSCVAMQNKLPALLCPACYCQTARQRARCTAHLIPSSSWAWKIGSQMIPQSAAFV